MRFLHRSKPTLSLAESRGRVQPPAERSLPPTLDRHLLDYVRIVFKRRWIALFTLAAVVGLAAVHLWTAIPIYEARAQILIEHENREMFSLQAGVTQDRETTDYYNTQYTILQSRSLAARALDTMNAWQHAELSSGTPRPAGTAALVTRWVKGSIARIQGGGATEVVAAADPEAVPVDTPAAAAEPGAPETPAQSAAINALLSRLKILPVQASRLVDIKVQAGDPAFAAAAANAVARAYIDQNLEVRISSSKETTDWLTDQLSAQRERILASENALQRYRENHQAVSVADRENIVAQKLTDLNAMVTKAKGDRIGREALYEQVRAIQSQEASLDTLPSLLSNTYLQQLKTDLAALRAEHAKQSQQLGDLNPVMISLKGSIADAEAKLKSELDKQVTGMEHELRAAQALEDSLTQALEAQKGEVVDMNRTGITYAALEREVTTNRQIFESLLARTREKSIAGELKASDVRVIDAAQTPRSPVWPRRNQTLFYALFFGSLFGVGLAFFFEYLDDRIKAPDEIKTYLGLPCLGMVPVLTGRQTSDRAPLLHDRDTITPMFSEAFRVVRTNVLFAAEGRARSLVITSTGPGEGKTIVATNMAVGLAMTGRSVVLLDVDMRRPQVHALFDLPKEPGLSDLLSGSVTLAQALRQTSVPGLSVLPSGTVTGSPAELLSSPRFGRLLTLLSERFQWVIIDSPPVAAVTDSCIVANRAAAVLFVVGSQLTSRKAALHAIEQLESADATFAGAILNRVHLRRDAFYYAPYYRPSYERYYMDAIPASAPTSLPASDDFDADAGFEDERRAGQA